MTRTTNARIAGFTYLAYIAIAFPSILLVSRATDARGTAAKLARIAEHTTDMRISLVLSLLSCFAAIVLAVTLYAITRDEDRDIARLGFACRLGEGLVGASFMLSDLGLLWLATSEYARSGEALGSFLLMASGVWNVNIAGTLFAVGSTAFCWLLLRGRMIPVPLAWLGVIASGLLVIALPLQLAGVLRGPVTELMYLPMAAFEITLGVLWVIKGDLTQKIATHSTR